MNTDDQVSYDDPQFVKILKTCLKMEITAGKEKLEESQKRINRMKMIMQNELVRRKQLKQKIEQMDKIRLRLSESLTRLLTNISQTSDTLEMMRANVDDQFILMELRSQEYRNIIAEYKETTQAYHARYEEFQLAKVRTAARTELKNLQIACMVMTYKKAEMTKINQQRLRINWIHTRCKIVEFAGVMVERSRLKEKLTRLRMAVECRRRELDSLETEIRAQRKREEDQRKLREQKMLETVPKINIPYRQIYAQTQMRSRAQQHRWQQLYESFDDTISVNTVVLEELCINENTAAPTELTIEMKSDKSNDPKCAAIQTKEPSNFQKSIDSEKTDTRAGPSAAPDATVNAEKTASADNDAEMKETYREETAQKKSQESTKTRAGSCTKENLLKHSVAKNTQDDEIEAKRVRLQRDDSQGRSSNKITTPPPSGAAEGAASKSPSSLIPKIRKIETVHYDLASIASMQRAATRSNVTAAQMFSPSYEYCESNISFSDQSFIKDSTSLYEGSLCNYRLSPNSNISPLRVNDNIARIASPPANPPDDKNQSDHEIASPQFQFSNLMTTTTTTTKAKGNFSIF